MVYLYAFFPMVLKINLIIETWKLLMKLRQLEVIPYSSGKTLLNQVDVK